jgi:hypothetical protein
VILLKRRRLVIAALLVVELALLWMLRGDALVVIRTSYRFWDWLFTGGQLTGSL